MTLQFVEARTWVTRDWDRLCKLFNVFEDRGTIIDDYSSHYAWNMVFKSKKYRWVIIFNGYRPSQIDGHISAVKTIKAQGNVLPMESQTIHYDGVTEENWIRLLIDIIKAEFEIA